MDKIRFTQIATASDDSGIVLYGLDTLGRLWVTRNFRGANWRLVEMPDVPEEDQKINTFRE